MRAREAVRLTEGVGRLDDEGTDGPRDDRSGCAEDGYRMGLGVTLKSADGARMRLGGLRGVRKALGAFDERSEIGGEGGVGVSEIVSAVETDLLSGGVVIRGDEAMESGDISPAKEGVFGAVISVDSIGSCLLSCRLSLSCKISASIFKSPSSSRRRCASIRSPSLSCSPILISSSIITALSIATLYFDSTSSRDDVVFLACLSKSSLATSISLSFITKVRFESRNVVISFWRVFCAAPASFFDCLYLFYDEMLDSTVLTSQMCRKGFYLPLLNLKT